jgi:hypothetical protein
MKFSKYLAVLALSIFSNDPGFAQQLWTIGPMLHVNFGGEKRSTSFTIEASYWNIKSFPYSVDFAIEFDRKKVRLYSEAQTGIGITGISLGPVLQFCGKGTKFGVQGSCWINYIVGVDYRIRYIPDETFHCVGFYAKFPIVMKGPEGDDGSFSWSEWDDWDD